MTIIILKGFRRKLFVGCALLVSLVTVKNKAYPIQFNLSNICKLFGVVDIPVIAT